MDNAPSTGQGPIPSPQPESQYARLSCALRRMEIFGDQSIGLFDWYTNAATYARVAHAARGHDLPCCFDRDIPDPGQFLEPITCLVNLRRSIHCFLPSQPIRVYTLYV